MSHKSLEKHIRKQVTELFGESWPLVAYTIVVRVTDPETMTADEPLLIHPPDQRTFVTRGLLEEALDELKASTAPVFAVADWADDDDADDF